MFITLEGIDRAGKTTQAERLGELLGPAAVLVREPGGTPASERIRALLKDPDTELDPVAELLLFCAARAELVARVIRPALAAGRDVVCDRFTDSTLAYQGTGRGLDSELVAAACSAATGGLEPDLTLLLRIDPASGAERAGPRAATGASDGSDRFEAEGLAFQRRVAGGYDEIAAAAPRRVVPIDATGRPGEVHERIVAAVEAARHRIRR